MSDIDVQMDGIVTPTYDKRRKGYKFKQDGMEIFIKGEDKDTAMKQMADLLDKEDSDDTEDSNSFAEGGMEDGGLKDEGGTVDPVSGNEVPSGSTQSEVRDDIPAQLSEGEFVLPADVVRYIGLENLMELRNKAKKGLAQMEDMGQMGNAEEAIMPDTAEMEVDIDAMIDEFDPNDPSTMSFAQGGVVKAQAGALVPGQMPAQQFSYGYQPPQQQTGYQPPQVPQTQFPDYTQFVSRPAQAAVGEERGITEQRQYIGPNGEMITIMFIDGKPQQEIPAGYKVYKPAEETPEVAKPQVQQRTDGGGDGPQKDNRTQLEKDMARTEPKTRDVAQDLIDNLTDPEAKAKVQAQLDKLNKSVKAAYAAPFALAVPVVGTTIAGTLVRNAVKEDNAMDAMIKEVSGLSTRQYRNEQAVRAADKGLGDTVRESLERQFGSDYLDSADLQALETGPEIDRINSFNQIVSDAGRSDLTISADDRDSRDSGLTSTADLGGRDDSFSGDRGVDTNRGPGGQRSGGDRDASGDTSGGRGSDPSGGASGSPFSKGGVVEQTKRALKSSRNKK